MSSSPAMPAVTPVPRESSATLLEHEVYELLAADGGIATPRWLFVPAGEPVRADTCREWSCARLVVKVAARAIAHKSDAGGVAFCENEPEALRAAVEQVLAAAARARPEARLEGVLVTEFVPHTPGLGRELLAGLRHDPAFGPVAIVGLGGLDSEVLLASCDPQRGRALFAADNLDPEQVAWRLRPTLMRAALDGTLRSARGRRWPEGLLVELVLVLARLARRHAGFAPAGEPLCELELNPCVFTDDGRPLALDGLARRRQVRPLPAPRRRSSLRALLQPESAVVIGASAGGDNVGRVVLRNLVAGGGVPRERLYVVHPQALEIEGCRTFKHPAELPERPDLAVIALPAERGATEVALELVTRRLAHSITLLSGGLAETHAGRTAEERLRAALDLAHADPDGGVPLNGGNCLGIVSRPGRYSTFFIPPYKLPAAVAGRPANLASLSQSGAYLVAQMANLCDSLSPRYAISMGNQTDLTVADYLGYLAEDPETRVAAVYLEGFRPGDGAAFLEAARRFGREGRRVLCYKAGRSAAGAQAAASHTASAVGDHALTLELLRGAGVVACDTLDAFEDAVVACSLLDGRAPTGRRLALLSNAGFECAVAADTLGGLELARLAPETLARLAELLPRGVVDLHNPVDATPATVTAAYLALAEALAADPGVDALVVAGVPATAALNTLPAGSGHDEDLERDDSLPAGLVRLFERCHKPLVCALDAGPLYEPCRRVLRRAGVPTFDKIDRAVRALARFLGCD